MQLVEEELFLGGGTAARVPLLGGRIVGVPDGAEGPVPKGGVIREIMLDVDAVRGSHLW